ncbi:glyoxylate/hydroxypyruvate reductase GhrA [Candidatus Pantoea floridensis]|uniref:Glyoxylate/hydroxypyruvate reductase A n=1 Tax=Candidatus Pantoea floridensis TaxID=1938870 RepID=A0A286BMD3_9GAMM|nr:glyoxylate/hydroxypyruvate reductase GhrA [Pantoea floridensis]PIF22468.1 glyoxylate/hydroxypyruvate reductase A [Enterobacteriaceae bacterium JKS000233]SOD35306.1 glyoxylate/hydroxypyruvate reductase A [Pantoea floridensis]
MEIIWYHPSLAPQSWLDGLQQRLPEARVRQWQPGDNAPADYAVVRSPPVEMLAGRELKGVFAMGAGVDEILKQLRDNPQMLADDVPLFRLEDTGMARQMQEYANWCVLGWFRRFAEYRQQQQRAQWQELDAIDRENFTIGVLGAGVLGRSVLESLRQWGFPLRCWSRSAKQIDGVQSFHGRDRLNAFLDGTQVLIDLLPTTPETTNLIDSQLLRVLPHGACFLNLARGAHVVEADLLAALNSGKLAAAALDVFQTEPLPQDHPLWSHPHVTITPHTAAITLPGEAMNYIAAAILAVQQGQQPSGLVDRRRGY